MPEHWGIKKLNNDNYEVWRSKLELLLLKEKVWNVIEEEKPATVTQAWTTADNDARATIGLLLEDDQMEFTRGAKSAKEAWIALENHHRKSTASGTIYLFYKLFRSTLSEGGDAEKHITDLSAIANKLSGCGSGLKDDILAAILLGSLPDSYKPLIMGISGSATELTSKFAKELILEEYRRRKNTAEIKDAELKVTEASETAMKIQSTKFHSDKTCFHCKIPGHLKKNCFKWKAWKKKQGISSANKVTECNMVIAHPESSPKVINACFNVKNSQKSNTWYLDSGATSHMACKRDLFVTLKLEKGGFVSLADENVNVKVEGIGKCVINCQLNSGEVKKIVIDNVLYVPRLSSNLVSIKKLARDGYKIILEGEQCNIFKGPELKAVVKPYGDLYELNTAEKALITKNLNCSKDCIHVWHRRLGHRSLDAIKSLTEKGLAKGIIIKDCKEDKICECCIKGKMARKSFPKESTNKTEKPLDLIHTDVCGPMQTKTPGNKRYILTLIDDFSRYTKIYLMETKDLAAACIKNYVELTKTQQCRKPRIIRSDRGKEYVNKNLQDYLRAEGIETQLTAPYSPEQNGVAERKNRSLLEMSRCMLIDAGLDNKYWGEAVATANYLQNRLPTRTTAKTPYELWFSQIPDLTRIKQFGCEAYVHIPKEKRRKLDEKAKKLIFTGYSEESKAYRLLDKSTNKIIISRDVVFLDEKASNPKSEGVIPISTSINERISKDIGKDDTSEVLVTLRGKKNDIQENQLIQEVQGIQENQPIQEDQDIQENQRQGDGDGEGDRQEAPQPRRSERTNKGVPPPLFVASAKLSIEEPRTRGQALSGPNKEKWMEAMDEEIKSLLDNETWEIVPAPKDRDVVSCKWVFKVKRYAQGLVDRFKARLVARGFSQKYGSDYDQVFAPVVRQVTFRAVLTIAGQQNMVMKHYDAKTAFLNGKLKEVVFMKQPEGYEVKGKENMVCRLIKSIYGLKQAARVWNERLHEILEELGFCRSEADPCLYFKITSDGITFIVVYVDDLLIAGKLKDIESTAKCLNKYFQLSDLGNLKHYLGIQVERQGNIISIFQEQYIERMLIDFGLEDAKPSKIPLDPGYLKTRKEDPMPDSGRYQQLIGALLYVAINTRPDIAASVNILSQYNVKPSTTDWTEVKRVLRYLKGTKSVKLKLNTNSEMNQLIGYADANWAENRTDRKSNSGYLFKLFGGPISWACRKQACVSLSSTEAEYVALAEACQEGVWLIRLLKDLQHQSQLPVKMYEDNQSCIKMVQNRKFSNRTKHIDTKYHYANEMYEKGIFIFEYCPTEDMLADIMTKPVRDIKLKAMVMKFGLSN